MAQVENFPSNSQKKPVVVQKPEQKKVVMSKVTTRKKSLGGKFVETFFDGTIEDVVEDVIFDTIVPAIKNAIADAVCNTVTTLIFGEAKKSRNLTRDRGRSYASYQNYYKRERNDRPRPRERSRYILDDVFFETRGDAEGVLDALIDYIRDYETVSVARLYEMCDIESEYTDEKYGWTNLSMASVKRTADGYSIDLPRPVVLD